MATNRLLVLDDEPTFSDIVVQVAASCGFDTRTVIDNAAFWIAYDAFDPTLIMADLSVSGARGSDIVHGLADRGCAAQVMMISGSDIPALALIARIGRARGVTMLESMTKPFHLDDLRARLTELVKIGG
jgi:DNA-binding response OmpR family regulator